MYYLQILIITANPLLIFELNKKKTAIIVHDNIAYCVRSTTGSHLQIAMMHLKVTIWFKVPVVTIQVCICNGFEKKCKNEQFTPSGN